MLFCGNYFSLVVYRLGSTIWSVCRNKLSNKSILLPRYSISNERMNPTYKPFISSRIDSCRKVSLLIRVQLLLRRNTQKIQFIFERERTRTRAGSTWLHALARICTGHGGVTAKTLASTLCLHLPDGSRRSGLWNMPTTNYAMAQLMLRPLLSTPICLMDHGGLNRGPCLLPTIHTLCHIHWMCCNSVMIPSVNMASIVLSLLERDPPLFSPEGFFPLFSLWTFFFFISWEFFLLRCEVLGQRCCMCTDCKALWGKFVICENRLYKINWNWIE